MAEHSPPPWHTGTDEDAHIVYDDKCNFVADTGRDDGNSELETANARLIAATPKLLDSLDLLLCLISVNGPDVGIISDAHTIRTINKARAAVAKATGEAIP